MALNPLPAWRCPVCQNPLVLEHRTYRCSNNHCFDSAKEGYVNLLPVQHKRSLTPGDDRAMVVNRREFLDRGYYQPLVDALSSLCTAFAAGRGETSFVLLDTGCGEGYYTQAIAQRLDAALPAEDLHISGIDISKDAVRLAARRYRQIHFAVASNAGLPVADHSVDCLLQIFAPGYDTELSRVLKPGGLFIRVSPGERHLYRLREMIYDQPKPHEVEHPRIEGLAFEQHQEVIYELAVRGNGDPGRLLRMTPYFWQANKEKQERILALDALETEAHFCLDSFRKPS